MCWKSHSVIFHVLTRISAKAEIILLLITVHTPLRKATNPRSWKGICYWRICWDDEGSLEIIEIHLGVDCPPPSYVFMKLEFVLVTGAGFWHDCGVPNVRKHCHFANSGRDLVLFACCLSVLHLPCIFYPEIISSFCSWINYCSCILISVLVCCFLFFYPVDQYVYYHINDVWLWYRFLVCLDQ